MFSYALNTLLKLKPTKSNLKLTLRRLSGEKKSKKKDCRPKIILMEPGCKVAVITGGTEGIGFATAHQLLTHKAQAVALVGLDNAKGLEAVNELSCAYGKDRAVFFKCDIKCKLEFDETMRKIKKDLQKVDILVNAAGIWNDIEWHEELETNLAGTINVNLVAQNYVNKGNGLIINLSGIHGLQSFSYSPIFAAVQSGIINFSQSLGHDLNFKKFGIRIVVLCTGITQTKFINDVEKRALTPDLGRDLAEFMKKACRQKSDACAKAVIELIKYGPTGSTWVIDGSRLFFLAVPDYKNFCSLISQFT